jgi:hypothetical protein
VGELGGEQPLPAVAAVAVTERWVGLVATLAPVPPPVPLPVPLLPICSLLLRSLERRVKPLEAATALGSGRLEPANPSAVFSFARAAHDMGIAGAAAEAEAAFDALAAPGAEAADDPAPGATDAAGARPDATPLPPAATPLPLVLLLLLLASEVGTRATPFPPRTASAALPAPRSERPPAAAEACAAGSIRAASVPSVGKSAGGAYEGTAAVESGEVEPPPQALKARPDEPGVTRADRSPSLPPPTSAAGADGAELLLGTGPGPGAGALAAADTGTAADGASGGLAPLAAIRARVAHGVSTAPSSFGGPTPQAGLAPAGAGGRAPPAGEARPEPPAVITSADGGLAAG